MKRISYLGLVIFLLTAATAITTWAQKVNVDFDKTANFSGYKTYAWASGTPAKNPLVDQRIVEGVDSRMAAKGLQKVESNSDLILTTLTATNSDLTMTNPSWAPQLNSIATGIPSSSQAWAVTKGTLMVDMSDAKTKNEVWRGIATHTLEQGPTGNPVHDAKQVEKPINKAVQKMFKNFPPHSKG